MSCRDASEKGQQRMGPLGYLKPETGICRGGPLGPPWARPQVHIYRRPGPTSLLLAALLLRFFMSSSKFMVQRSNLNKGVFNLEP